MKRFFKYLLATLACAFCVCSVACGGSSSSSNQDSGPRFLEGSLERVKFTDDIVIAEYVEYVTDSEYKIEIKGANGYCVDVTRKKSWTPEEPGEYTIVYTVYDGEFKGVSEFALSIYVPKITWSYSVNNDFYDVGEAVIFEQFFGGMNIAVESYYPWKMVMDSVTVDGVTTEIAADATSYTIASSSDHTFAFHLETEDGQMRYLTQDVSVRYADAATLQFLTDNNMEESGAIVVAEGRVTLNAGQYGGGKTTGAPRSGARHEQAYLAYVGEYGINDFVAFDFTGNNMPALGFFENDLENSIFSPELKTNEKYKGITVTDGFTQNDGKVFGKWTSSICARLAVSGPQKISNIDTDTEGWFRSGIRGVPMLGMTDKANNPDTKFRIVVGFVEGTSTHATLAFYLCNRETGEVYYKGHHKVTFDASKLVLPIDEDYYKGSIVAYGHYGKRMAFDKIYPVVHADSLQEAIETFFPLSNFQETAKDRVQANVALNVADYIVTVPGYTPTLKVIDENGTITTVTGDTFTLDVGSYTLQYNDGKNDTRIMQVQASDISANGQTWLTDNNVTYNRLVSIANNGKIVLGAGTTSAADGRPTETTVNDYAYLAFNNQYKVYRDGGDVGVYVGIEFTGNNMPNVLFFGDEITNNIFSDGGAIGNKGMLYSNGCTLADGSLFSGWETSVNNRLNLYGPNKVKNMGRDFDGFNRWLIKSAWLGMVKQAENANMKFRLIIGFTELRENAENQYVKATIWLENAVTGEKLYGGTCKILATQIIPDYVYEEGSTVFSEYFSGGKIAVYGQIGKTTTIDKLYVPTQAKGGVGSEVFGEHSRFNGEAQTVVNTDTVLRVSDYIVTQSGFTHTLNLMDANGVVTPITGDTFTIDKAGNYTLSYCDGKNFANAMAIKAISIALEEANKMMSIGETLQLNLRLDDPSGDAIVWSTDNPDVVEVDNTGKVTALAKGTANVTVTVGDQSLSCVINVCERYEISTVAQFMAMPTGDESVYCILTQDIDFAGTLIQYGATPSGTTYAPIGTATSKFSGILDGNGYAIKNVNIIGNGGAAMFGCVFAYVDGTIKNLAADVTLTAVTKSAKDVGFIYYLYAGASVENCYIRFNTNATQYGNGNGRAVGAIAGVINADGGVATIKNCVGVLDLTNLNSSYDGSFGGAASIVGGNISGESTVNILNCYGVTLTAPTDTKNTPKLDSNDTTSSGGVYNPGVVNKSTSSAYGSMYDMYVAAKTGMTAENGWSSLWTVSANGSLKFGDETIFEVYEISTVADFMALPMNDANAYCVLMKDIDFSGIVINQTEGYMTIGYPAGATHETPGTSATVFAGVLDGNGFALKNVTVAPLAEYGGSNTTVGQPNLIYAICGTVKNLSVDLTLKDVGVNSARFGGFTSTLQSGAHISNCYFELTSTHYVASNYPLAPLAGFVAASTGAITIENCVGVLNKVANSRNGGLAGGLIGRVSMANGGTVNVKNCYAVEVDPNDGTTAAQVFVQASGWQAPSTLVNSTAYTALADLVTAAQTGITAENGWNSLWTVSANGLTFGTTTIA